MEDQLKNLSLSLQEIRSKGLSACYAAQKIRKKLLLNLEDASSLMDLAGTIFPNDKNIMKFNNELLKELKATNPQDSPYCLREDLAVVEDLEKRLKNKHRELEESQTELKCIRNKLSKADAEIASFKSSDNIELGLEKDIMKLSDIALKIQRGTGPNLNDAKVLLRTVLAAYPMDKKIRSRLRELDAITKGSLIEP